MSWKPVFWLVAMVLLVGGFVLVFENSSEPVTRSLPLETPVLRLNPALVTRLSITVGQVQVDCVKREGEWYLTRPVAMRADATQINRLLDALGAVKKYESIDPVRQEKRGLTLASFGLDAPKARYVVGTELRADEILLGDSSPMGDLVYLRLNGDRTIIGATCRLPDLFPVDVDGLRDRAVFPPGIRRAIRLELKHSGGFVQLAFRDGVWRIQQPFEAPADGARVERLLQALEALRIVDFKGEFALTDPSLYGLAVDDAVLQVSVWPEGRRDPLILTVGKARVDNPSVLHAMISDMAPIGAVDKEVLSLQMVTAEAFRDRRLCDADPSAVMAVTLREGDSRLVLEKSSEGVWMLMDPLRSIANARAMGVLLRVFCGLHVEERLLQVPPGVELLPCRVTLSTTLLPTSSTNETLMAGGAGKVWSYRFGVPGTDTTHTVVYSEESKTAYRILANDLAKLWTKVPGRERSVLSDPLIYMDCRMLDMNPQDIRRITLTRQNREETVTIGPDGLWGVNSPPDGQVAEGAIPSLLRLASSLQAERIEGMAITNMAAYGLSDSATRITFGLSGTTGIQKTILIGEENGQEGVYSLVQGQDIVYVLKKDVADALVHPLVTTP